MPKYEAGDAVVTRGKGNAIVHRHEGDFILFRFSNGSEAHVCSDGLRGDIESDYDIVARLVPDTGTERALRLLRRLNETHHVSLEIDDDGDAIVWHLLDRDSDEAACRVAAACEPTPLAAVEAAASALGVELGEVE